MVDGQLQVVAGLDPKYDGSSFQTDLSLADINNDGKTAIVTKDYGAGTNYALDVIAFDGKMLKPLTPVGADTTDAYLEDINGDGKLELIVPPYTFGGSSPDYPVQSMGVYKVYQFNGTAYEFSYSSSREPADADRSVYAGFAKMEPDRFTLADIQRAKQNDANNDGEIVVRIADLSAPTSNNPGPRSVNDVNMNSLLFAQRVRPIQTEILPSGDQNDDSDSSHSGPILKAYLSQNALFLALPYIQFGPTPCIWR